MMTNIGRLLGFQSQVLADELMSKILYANKLSSVRVFPIVSINIIHHPTITIIIEFAQYLSLSTIRVVQELADNR